MRFQNSFAIRGMILIVAVLFLMGFEVKKTNTSSVQGTIESIDKDFRNVVVNGTKFSLSVGTKIVDEKGNALKAKDLKLALPVTIEGLRTGEGFSATAIVIGLPKRKP